MRAIIDARQAAGAVAADGDVGHQLDVMLAEDRGQLHRGVALAADRVDAQAIRVGFRRAHRAQSPRLPRRRRHGRRRPALPP